eukprot:705709-Amphidinium_carterae.1
MFASKAPFLLLCISLCSFLSCLCLWYIESGTLAIGLCNANDRTSRGFHAKVMSMLHQVDINAAEGWLE